MRAKAFFDKKTALKLGISLALVFHLYCIVLSPNSNTYLGTRSKSVVAPYVSFLELSSTWGFFAPDPGPPPVFIEYEVVGEGGSALRAGTWPERVSPYFLRERQNRRIAVARFLMASPERVEKVMGPYYCRQHPEARSVRLWRVIEGMPNLHDVAAGKRKIDDRQSVERKYVNQYLCEGRG